MPRRRDPAPPALRLVERSAETANPSSSSPIIDRYRAFNAAPFLGKPEEVASLTRDEARGLLQLTTILRGRLDALAAMVEARLAELEEEAGEGTSGDDDRILTIKQAAEWLNRHESYVAELVRKRRIPSVQFPSPQGKAGKYSGIRFSSLKEWAKAHEDPGIRK